MNETPIFARCARSARSDARCKSARSGARSAARCGVCWKMHGSRGLLESSSEDFTDYVT